MSFQNRKPTNSPPKARSGPSEDTGEEVAYLKFLGDKQKQVQIKLADGEVVEGWIEYYDKNMVRVTRDSQPNLFIFKHDIMYIEENGTRRGRP